MGIKISIPPSHHAVITAYYAIVDRHMKEVQISVYVYRYMPSNIFLIISMRLHTYYKSFFPFFLLNFVISKLS